MMPDSSAQRSFLQKHKKRQQFIRLMRIAVFLVFLIVWEISARLGLIDSFIFGSPSQVCLAFRALLLTNHLSWKCGFMMMGRQKELNSGWLGLRFLV